MAQKQLTDGGLEHYNTRRRMMSPSILYAKAMFLKGCGLYVWTAEDAQGSGKHSTKREQPKLVISAVVMPGMRGPSTGALSKTYSLPLKPLLMSGTWNAALKTALAPMTESHLTKEKSLQPIAGLWNPAIFAKIEEWEQSGRSIPTVSAAYPPQTHSSTSDSV